jgi:histidyl-tRNA synthetase
MQKTRKDQRPAAELPKGFIDVAAEDLQATGRMLETIRRVYHSYGFEPLDTPALEYTEALGKFLPDQDRPNAGVFSFQDEDERWMSLRYDLTAPLARYVAANFDKLPKPFRRYAVGPVWRNEKPGPGRYRQFTQFDADTVGTDSVAADAEICMLIADTMEALGLAGKYVIKVNNRKVLDGLMEVVGLEGDENFGRRLSVLRAIDKLDRLGVRGVRELLGSGRKDESGDFTKGVELQPEKIDLLIGFVAPEQYVMETDISRVNFKTALMSPWQPVSSGRSIKDDRTDNFAPDEDHNFEGGPYYLDTSALLPIWSNTLRNSRIGLEGVEELSKISSLVRGAGYGSKRFEISSSVVRGLEYYTGPVFEAELTFQVKNEDGQTVRFGSVGGGGRYDGLVERFLGTKVPATGFSIGVSRLQAALAALNKDKPSASDGPVVVLVMDKGELPRYQKMAQALRQAGIRAEMYLGTSGMKAQMKYADRRGSPCVVIQGGDEIAKGEVQIKDLIEGAKAAESIKDSKEWREGRPAQVSVPEAELVEAVRSVLARHRSA